MKKWLFTFLLCPLTIGVNGQTIAGKIVDEQQNPLEFANVVLLSLPDSSFVQGSISDQNGTFSLMSNAIKGVLRISSIGYSTSYVQCNSEHIGTIQLVADAKMLDEVVVKSNLPQTRLKGNSSITGVTGTILEKAGTAENLLDKIPGVSATGGSVNVFGKGTPEIYINGRKMRGSFELDQLSSDNIKSVEVINNPGARYGASVKAVIRITTQKAVGDGFGFNDRFSTNYRYDWTVLNQFDFNYRKGGFDLAGMLYGSSGRGKENKKIIQNTYLDKQWSQISTLANSYHNQYLSGMLALNYQFNKNHTLGIRYNYERVPKRDYRLNMLTDVYKEDASYEKSNSHNAQITQSTDHRANIYYNGKIGDWDIDFNADGVWNRTNLPSLGTEEIVHADETSDMRTITTFGSKKNTLYAAKLIVSHPIWGGNFSLGGEYSHNTRFNQYANEEGFLANDKSEIKEGVLAAFLEYSRAIGKVNMQAGVRYENAQSDYYEFGKLIDEQSRDYNNVFPSLAFSFPIGKVQTQLSYAADITRPAYNQLRGNISYANRYTYESGNPLLRPTLSHNLNFGASYKWAYLSVGYQHIKDGMINFSRAYSDDPTIALLWWMNTSAYDKASAMLSLRPTIGKWTPQFIVQVLQQWYMADTPDGKQEFNHPVCTVAWKNSIELPAGFLLGADASFTTRGYSGNIAYDKVSWGINASLYKDFLSKRLTCLLQATDIFNTGKNRMILYSGIRTMDLEVEARRAFILTLRYSFNSAKSKYKGTGAGQSQKNRM